MSSLILLLYPASHSRGKPRGIRPYRLRLITTLLVYACTYGCSADCAAYLKPKLPDKITLLDINKNDGKVEPFKFDTIVIGESVYMGNISPKLLGFCPDNIGTLLNKKLGL